MTQPQPQRSDAPAQKALLVDDSGSSALIARRFLGRLGYEVQLMAEGSAALEACRRAEFDLLLVDLKLLGPDALQAIEKLRAEANAELMIVALGSAQGALQLRSWRAAGIDGQLDRPLDLSVLERELLRCRAARRRKGSPAGADALDVEALLEEVDGDRTLLANLSELFDQQAAERMRELAAAIEQGAAADIDHTAHALKSMIGLWQRGAAYELAASLEQMGRDGRAAAAKDEHLRLIDALSELQRRIHELVRAESMNEHPVSRR